MSTHASIIVEFPDRGIYKSIYVHFDGYLSGVGHTLFKHYNSFEKAKELVELGDCSVLKSTVGASVFYNRDRNEDWEDVKPLIAEGLHEANKQQDYDYVFKEDAWWLVETKTEASYALTKLVKDVFEVFND